MIVHKLPVSTRLICNCERLCQMMRTIRSISIPGWFSPQLPHYTRPGPRHRCHCHGIMFRAGPPGLPRLTQAVAAGRDEGSLSGRNYNSPLTDFQPFTGNIILTGFSGTAPCRLALTSQPSFLSKRFYKVLC